MCLLAYLLVTYECTIYLLIPVYQSFIISAQHVFLVGGHEGGYKKKTRIIPGLFLLLEDLVFRGLGFVLAIDKSAGHAYQRQDDGCAWSG